MSAGRPPKPKPLHILEGTWKKCRHGDKAEVAGVELGEPVVPGHLKGEALKFWKAQVPRLLQMKVATAADAPALAQLCVWWATCRRLEKFLNRIPDTDKRLFRVVANLATATDKFHSIACRFGMTPSDRARLRVGSTKAAPGIEARKRPGSAGTA